MSCMAKQEPENIEVELKCEGNGVRDKYITCAAPRLDWYDLFRSGDGAEWKYSPFKAHLETVIFHLINKIDASRS